MPSYVMTLSGVKRPVRLMGVTDTVRAHPFAIVGGLVVGLFFGLRRKRRR